ncbi:MAG: 7-cyano-7-deazaguanine synthase QueC [Thermodesulfovibrio sp.]|uniref:7-cyano-7-deazaguanine synthase QueC n=1 Tax=unclassified Thermodesulfovibrio TaxID=2645936 RepID=UPI00083A9AA4|nr:MULTISPECIES: 7-cyano-7-deazaguanine synthase QueC [unclassified Thermodesulfovibrio]MDI1471998.1 7-cyano-7-deazaguanine synthase QueC [Thermodesulfovibrio sp. 1176]MDI6715209.1 7-cyano-7-deazaguanine synthase QueC [Thermodesulfovibrio sp.]ODA45245.1 Queuosine Biosynthesis QueC ATPase [Thermodesulfovibrio sp. N1]
MKKAVVLLSGGIDSSTTLALAKNEGFECYAISFDYKQRHSIELEFAKKVAKHVGVKEHLIVSFDLRKIGGSALTSKIEIPKDTQEGIPVTYVPARNTIFLSFALAWAEVLQTPYIFIGANVVDYSGYPDCRPEYLSAFEYMANLATKASVEGTIKFKIQAPLLYLTKTEIIKKGIELGLDYSLTWSCYYPQGEPPKPCLKCPSCIYRLKGFEEAGIKDPLLK